MWRNGDLEIQCRVRVYVYVEFRADLPFHVLTLSGWDAARSGRRAGGLTSSTPTHPSTVLLLGCRAAVCRDLDLGGGLDERQQLLVQTGCELFTPFGCDRHRKPLGHDGGAELCAVVRGRCAS